MRHFTVEEANVLVPTLTAVLQDLQRLHQRMLGIAEDVAAFETLALQNGHGGDSPALVPDNDMTPVRQEIEQRLLYLQGIGVQLKGIAEGIVDFPARMWGRDVYLCWHLGEETVSHWHDIDAGFAGRQPL
jgi:hypothetical protein